MTELIELFNKLSVNSIEQSDDYSKTQTGCNDLHEIIQQMNNLILDENIKSQNIDNIIESLNKLDLNENNKEKINILRQICYILYKKSPCGTQINNTIFRPNFVH